MTSSADMWTQAEFKAERMFDLVERFRAGARLSPRDIAEHYGCSLRTAQRTLRSLQKTGVALYDERVPGRAGAPRRVYRLVKR